MKPWIAALSLLSSAAFAHDSYFAGARWHLLSIQSMDDTQGGTRIDDPSRFSLHFQPDGQAVFRLDGNRGTGHYQVSPSADLSNGQMSFGPVAATRALCQPPHLDVHATVAACVPPYTSTRACEAQGVCRGFDGTATVLMRWDEGQVRRILFVKGQVVASDAQQAFKATRTADGWLVEFGDGERYEVPEPLVMGG